MLSYSAWINFHDRHLIAQSYSNNSSRRHPTHRNLRILSNGASGHTGIALEPACRRSYVYYPHGFQSQQAGPRQSCRKMRSAWACMFNSHRSFTWKTRHSTLHISPSGTCLVDCPTLFFHVPRVHEKILLSTPIWDFYVPSMQSLILWLLH